MPDMPFARDIVPPGYIPTVYAQHIVRRLSEMRGQYADEDRYREMLAREDVVLYEVYAQHRPQSPGELLYGTSIVHPGKVGDEYWMTKGHFHAVLETAEVYYCLQGEGMMVMETPEGDWAVEELRPGRVLPGERLRWCRLRTQPGVLQRRVRPDQLRRRSLPSRGEMRRRRMHYPGLRHHRLRGRRSVRQRPVRTRRLCAR